MFLFINEATFISVTALFMVLHFNVVLVFLLQLALYYSGKGSLQSGQLDFSGTQSKMQ